MNKDFYCEHTFSPDGTIEESLLVFSFLTKEVLNSNSLPRNTYYLSKLVKNIRDVASKLGAQWHLEPIIAETSYEYNKLMRKKTSLKSKATREMNKDGISLEEQEDILLSIDKDFQDELYALDFINKRKHYSFIYDKCSIKIGVSPPSNRKFDPPNFWPTIKPIIDGLTDSLWWEDDNFNHIQSTEFHYIPPNKTKKYQFYIKIEHKEGD